MDTDRELLTAHVEGDAEAFGELFGRHRDRLWAVALRTTGDPELAADGLQDAMIAAFRRADSFRGDAQVTTWLHRIVVNACLDLLRRRSVRRADPLPEDLDRHDLDSRAGGRGHIAEDASDPADQHVRRERADRILAALQQLPVEQRTAVVLVDMEGYPVAEAADILDCPIGTIKSRCSRGRARLASLLADLLDTESETGVTRPDGNPPAAPGVGSENPRGPPATPMSAE